MTMTAAEIRLKANPILSNMLLGQAWQLGLDECLRIHVGMVRELLTP